jgi:hypothetical protein
MNKDFEDFKQDTARQLVKALKDKEAMFPPMLLNFGDDELFKLKFDLLENKVRPILKMAGLDIGNIIVINFDKQDAYL